MKQSGVCLALFKRAALLPLCVLACIAATETKGVAGEASLQPGKGSFGIDCGINSSSQTIGLRYFLTDAISVRPGFSVNLADLQSESGASTAESATDKYGLNLDVTYHFRLDDAFSLYSGLSYKYDYSGSESKTSPHAFNSAEGDVYSHSLLAVVGFQFMLTKHFGLLLETSIGFQHRQNKSTAFDPDTGIEQSAVVSTEKGLVTTKGTLGAVFYF